MEARQLVELLLVEDGDERTLLLGDLGGEVVSLGHSKTARAYRHVADHEVVAARGDTELVGDGLEAHLVAGRPPRSMALDFAALKFSKTTQAACWGGGRRLHSGSMRMQAV